MSHKNADQPVGFPVDGWTPPPRPVRAPLEGHYVCVEPLSSRQHCDELYAAFEEDAEGINWTYRAQEPFPDLEAFRSWLEMIETDDENVFFAYRDKASGKASGMGALMTIAPAAGSIEVGSIMFSPSMQRTRAATEAMFLKMRWAFEAGYRRYEWTCHGMNVASMNAALRFGFSFEAVFRKALVSKGRNRDKVVFSCLDGEWPALRDAYDEWLLPNNFDADGTQRKSLSTLTGPLLVSLPGADVLSAQSSIHNAFGQPLSEPVANWSPASIPERRQLAGTNCVLEPLAPHHGPALYEALKVDEAGRTWTYMPNGPFSNFEEYETWLQAAILSSDPLHFAIVVDGRALGTASFLRIEPEAGSIEVGYITYSPALQRTRAATETMYLMMKWAFDAGYRRYEWKCNALNAPSCSAAKRLGFTFEGIFRQMMVVKGQNRDSAWYSITDDEWPAIRAAMQAWLDPSNFNEAGRQKTSLSDLTNVG